MAYRPEPRHGYWDSLLPDTRSALFAIASRATFATGSTLLHQHDTDGDVYIIWSGLTKVVTRTANGRQMVLALRGPGDVVGELAVLRDGCRSAAVVAVTWVSALTVDQADFKRFIRRHPDAADSLYRTVVDRLCEADRDRLAAASMNVGQRLARLLVKIVQRYGVATPTGTRIDELSQKELAACVGGGERTIAREIGGWRERNIISTDRRSIIVHRPESLERIAGRNAPP